MQASLSWQTGGCYTDRAVLWLFTLPEECQEDGEENEERDSPNDINSSGEGIQLKTVMLEREQVKLDG